MNNIVLENKNFALTIGEDALVKSLIYKKTGEELTSLDEDTAIFSLTQLRPFNNEVKLAYMNKKTTFEANKIEVNGNELTVSFEIIPCKAKVTFDIKDEYISFTLKELFFIGKAYGNLCMDLPPVEGFRLLQIPVKNKKNFGHWINAMWDDEASVAVIAAMPEALIDSEKRPGYRILTADAKREIMLEGVTAALVVSGGEEKFLDVIDTFERDYGLPLGVESRRKPTINRSIYSARNLNRATVDEHIKYAKMGGFECILMYFDNMCVNSKKCYDILGEYEFNENYPNGYDDLRYVLSRIKEAGIRPGIHFLHTHIGIGSSYVKGGADHRLNLTMYFTLAKPLGVDDDEIYVEQNPQYAAHFDMARFAHLPQYEHECHVLKFGSEIMYYKGFTTERPYRFYGVKRGHWGTTAEPHALGEIGGQPDVTEYSSTSIYLNQHTDLQDEVGQRLAALYNCGFEFIYFDGSEGTNPPFEYHVPHAQYRVLKKLNNLPIFCEGAAKAHFSWHFVTGGNAFDSFKMEIFKKMIDKFPLAEAPDARRDFTRLNFGWWSFYDKTQKDMYEYGTSRAFAWNCPITMSGALERLSSHPRVKDIMEVMRRWENARRNNILTEADKEMLKVAGQEHTLLINEKGEYELTPYFEVEGVGGDDSDVAAFVFERLGKAYAVMWHKTGEAELSIPLSDAKYERDLGKETLEVKKANGGITVKISDAAYLSAEISIEELKSALKSATVV